MDKQQQQNPAPAWLAVLIFIFAPIWGMYAVSIGEVSLTQPRLIDKIIFVILSPGMWVTYQIMLHRNGSFRFIPLSSMIVSLSWWAVVTREVVRFFFW